MTPIPLIFLFGIAVSQECYQKNTSCSDIKAASGFMFSHGGNKKSDIFVYHNETLIARGILSAQTFTLSKSVISMDDRSVITRDCWDLKVKSFVQDGNRVKEDCLDYKITEETSTSPYHSPIPQDLIIGVLVAVILAVALVGIIVFSCYVSWKKEKKKQHGASADSSFLSFLLTCHCFRDGNSQAASSEEGTSLSEIPPEPRESEPGCTLGSVRVHSIDSTADGETPQSLSLDRNLSNEGMQPSKNGDVRAPDVNRATNPRAMHRGLRHDPGGVNDDKGNDRIGEMHNGWTHGDRGPEDHENERLLSNQRAAIQSSDMTGGAAVLVNKRGSDPDQVSRCSTAPDTDVESTLNMKKSTHVVYNK